MASLGEGNGKGIVSSRARAVSWGGTLVAGCGTTADGEVAFLWDGAHGMRTLSDVLLTEHGTAVANWLLKCITAMSADGRVLGGYGINPQGRTECWIVQLPGQ